MRSHSRRATRPLLPLASAICLVSAVLVPEYARACSCAEAPPPCEAYWAADAVFVGTVVQVGTTEEDTSHGRARRQGELSALFEVHESWRGIPRDSILVEVRTESSSAMCGASFAVGQLRLVYASRGADGILRTGLCSRGGRTSFGRGPDHGTEEITKFLEGAVPEDVSYLRSVAGSDSTGSLFGTVADRPREARDERSTTGAASRKRLEAVGVKVVVTSNEGGLFETEPDETGVYRISGLPLGRHEASVVAPKGYALIGQGSPGDSNAYDFEIEIRGPADCAGRDFFLENDSRIEGRIRDAAGGPVAGMRVSLIPVRTLDGNPDSLSRLQDDHVRWWGETDSSGTYELERAPRGDYLVALNYPGPPTADSPFPTLYFPGVEERKDATPLSLGVGAVLRLDDMRLPPPLPTRTLIVRVQWPDGLPVANARFDLMTRDGIRLSPSGNAPRSDAEGRGELTLLAGQDYLIASAVHVHGDWHHGHFAYSSSLASHTLVTIVLDLPGPQCRLCAR